MKYITVSGTWNGTEDAQNSVQGMNKWIGNCLAYKIWGIIVDGNEMTYCMQTKSVIKALDKETLGQI